MDWKECFVDFKDKILDVSIPAQGKSFAISDIEWFCQTMNDLFKIETRSNRRNEQIIQQFKHTLGDNVRLIFKRDLRTLKINSDEVFTHL